MSWIALSSLAMRDFSSSTESLSDCICPEAVSSLPPRASFCGVQLLLQRVHRRAHLRGLVGRLLRKVLQHAEALSKVDCSRCTMSSNCCTWVCSSMISFDAACAGAAAVASTRQTAAARRRVRNACSPHVSPYDNKTCGSLP